MSKLLDKIKWLLTLNRRKVLAFFSSMMLCLLTFNTSANPVLGNIAAGNVSIQQLPASTVIKQSSHQAIINWQSFNIGGREATHFIQPKGGIALNRINPNEGASQIYGTLTATGQIILVNSAGIYFGPSAYVNVGGLIASTADITNKDFLKGNYHFVASPLYNGSIINEGTIIAADHGLVALLGSGVSNSGLIRANMGHAVLGSGREFSMTLDGNDLISFTVDSPSLQLAVDQSGHVLKNGVSNTGRIITNGGQVLVTADAASGLLDHAISMQGYVEAQSVNKDQNGSIIFSASPNSGNVQLASAKLNVANHKGGVGGDVIITGDQIILDNGTQIDASGNAGGGNILIGGNAHGVGALYTASLTYLAPGASLNADALTSGNGGNIILWGNDATAAYGTISARGGVLGGNGGNVETSGHQLAVEGLSVDLSAPHGTAGNWLLDPADLSIVAAGSTTAELANSVFGAGNSNSDLLIADLTAALATANVTVETSINGTGGNGDIFVATPINWSSGNNLTLSAYRNITSNATITNTGGASVILQADNTGTGVGIVSFTAGNNVSLSGGTGSVSIYYNPANFGTGETIYTGGTAPTSYMLINNLTTLQTLMGNSNFWGGNFALGADINVSNPYGPTANFAPIGNSSVPFSGLFDGMGHTISNFFLEDTSDNTGLFGETSNAAVISNLNLSSLNMYINSNNAGGLVGTNNGLLLNDSITSSQIYGEGYDSGSIGGLVGINNGTVNNSFSSALVDTSSGTEPVGGLVGTNSGAVINSYVTGTVNGSDDAQSGGLIAINYGTVSGSYNNGNLNGGYGNNVGGLIGYNNGLVSNAYNTGSIISYGNSLGGIVGYNDYNGIVSNTYNSGSIGSIYGGSYIGGVLGYNNGTLSNSYNTDSVSGSDHVGGLVGDNAGSASTSYNTGSVSGYDYIGGLVGYNSASLSDSYNIGNVYSYDDAAGGLVGFNDSSATVLNTYSTGGVFGSSDEGGLIGINNAGSVFNSFWDVQTSGLSYSDGGTGYFSTTPLLALSTYNNAGWNIGTDPTNNTWLILDGHTRPMLAMEYSTIITTPDSLQLIGLNATTLNAHYTLANDLDMSETIDPAGLWGGQGFYTPGTSSTPFSGTFNGNGHSIINLSTNGNELLGVTTPAAVITNLANVSGSLQIAVWNFNFQDSNYTGGPLLQNFSFNSVLTPGSLTICDSCVNNLVSGYSNTTDFTLPIADLTTLLQQVSATFQTSGTSGDGLGDIIINTPINWNTATTLNLNAYRNLAVNDSIANTGGGSVVLKTSGGGTGSITFAPGTNVALSGGSGQVKIYYSPIVFGIPDALYTDGTTPIAYMLINSLGNETDTTTASLAGLSNMPAYWEENFALNAGIDAEATQNWNNGAGFSPIGNAVTPFSGSFDGQGYTISNLMINQPGQSNVGLFGVTTANTALSNIGVTGTFSGGSAVGALVGNNAGTINNAYSEGIVSGTGNAVGGLVGFNSGNLTDAYTNAAVSGDQAIGGLVGNNTGSINQAYSSGAVSGNANAGGLVGQSTGSVNSSFWDTDTSLVDTSAGGIGSTTAGLLMLSTYSNAGWNIGTDQNSNNWVIFDGSTRPMLAMEYSTNLSTAHSLQLVGLNTTTLSANYILTNDINADSTNPANIWAGGSFIPIGDSNLPFSGTFEGAEHVIRNLLIENVSGDAGLFADTSNTAVISDVNLGSYHLIINNSSSNIGGLVGSNYGSIINDAVIDCPECLLTTSILDIDNSTGNVGGLIGYNNGQVVDSKSKATINSNGFSFFVDPLNIFGENVGGLIGFSDWNGNVTNSSNTGNINFNNDSGNTLGGLIGSSNSTVSNSYNLGTLTTNNLNDVGGLIGFTQNNVTYSYNAGTVNGTYDTNLGGLIGSTSEGTVSNAYNTGAVNSNNGYYVGGLIGFNAIFDVNTVYNSGPVNFSDGGYVGGLVGFNIGGISSAHNSGAVTDLGSSFLSELGGLVGYNGYVVSNAYNTGAVNGGTPYSTEVGGLIGQNQGNVDSVYNTGSVQGNGDGIGGLIGQNFTDVSNAYNLGVVNGTGNSVGGLVGENDAGITDAYNIGAVTGNMAVGGLVGFNQSSINNTYNSGAVTYTGTGSGQVGGLVGSNSGNVTNSFWDTQTSGQAASAAGSGETTDQLLALSTYSSTGWNIGTDPYSNVWLMLNGQTRPMLSTEYTSTISTPHALQLMSINTAALNGTYVLSNALDMSVTADPAEVWAGKGLVPIGNPLTPFSGSFDGQDHVISNLTIDRVGQPDAVLFGATTATASTTNFSLQNTSYYLGNGTLENFFFNFDAANLSICASCINNLTTAGTNSDLTLPETDLATLLAFANVTIQTSGNSTDTFGNITVDTPINWSSAATLSLSAYRNLMTTSNFSNTGGGNLVLKTNIGTIAFAPDAHITLSGGNGQVKLYYTPTVFGIPNTFYTGGTTPISYMLINSLGNGTDTTTASLASLSNLPMYWGENFVLNANIDANATQNWNNGDGFSPIGTTLTPFSGTFDGQGYLINNLFINLPNQSNVGLFGVTAANATLSNIGVAGNIQGNNQVGGLVGNNAGSISNAFSMGSITGTGTSVGGLVGLNSGNIATAYSVASTTGNQDVGGLVGTNSGSLLQTYSSGAVIGSNAVGGLVGQDESGLVTNSFWDMQTSGLASSAGGTGESTNSLMSLSTYSNAGWNIGTDPTMNNWLIIDGSTRPMLAMEYSTAVGTAHGLQLVGLNTTTLNQNYTVANDIDLASSTNPADIWGGSSFIPLGTPTSPFSGSFNGLGNPINDLSFTNVAGDVGLFGDTRSTAVISNLNLAGVQMVLTGSSSNSGGLVGSNNGLILNDTITASSIAAADSSGNIGGLVGYNHGQVMNSSSAVTITSTGSGQGNNPNYPLGANVGGLIGLSDGDNVSNSYSAGNLDFTNASGTSVGGLIGFNSSPVSNSHNTGMINVSNVLYVGGLIGSSNSNISEAYNSGTVEASNGTYIGGVIGASSGGNVSDTYNTGTITGHSNALNGLGGLIGQNTSNLDNVYNTGAVNGSGVEVSNIGGLVGSNGGNYTNTINQAYNTGLVYAPDGVVGGLIGLNSLNGVITHSYNNGSIGNGNASNVGGLIGENWGTVTSSYNNGSVHSSGNNMGGLIGENVGTVTSSYNNGLISGNGNNMGGLIGENLLIGETAGTVTSSYNEGTVNGDGTNLGGLIGFNSGHVTNTYNTGAVSGCGYDCMNIGGLIGQNQGFIFTSYNTGTVSLGYSIGGLVGENGGGYIEQSYNTGAVIGSGSIVGGLVGNNYLGYIYNSYNSGAVTGDGGYDVGGLVGNNTSTLSGDDPFTTITYSGGVISNAYNTGAVTGSGIVGGLVGYNETNTDISNTYSSGTVSYSGTPTGQIGGLIGANDAGTVTNSFWDTQTSGQATSAAGMGQTTTQLLTESTYSAANFNIGTDDPTTNTWLMIDGASRPMLAMEYTNTISSPHALQLIDINPTTLGGTYALATNLDMSGSTNVADIWGGKGFIPIGSAASPFTGSLNGQGNLISSIMINQPTATGVGLFGETSASALLTNLGVTGTVNGGLQVGMLVGNNAGTLAEVFSDGSVIAGGTNVGGLVGINSGVLSNVFSLASASGNQNVGGLVGLNIAGATVTDAYSTGAVSGQLAVGGLVGVNNGTVQDAVWDTQTSGQAASAAGMGETTLQLLTKSTYSGAGFNIGTDPNTNTWLSFDGLTRPMLAMQYSTQVGNAYALQLMGINPTTLGANYTLTGDINLSATLNPAGIWAGKGLVAIGNTSTPFTGSLNGTAHALQQINFIVSGTDPDALFGALAPTAAIYNLTAEGTVAVDRTAFTFNDSNYTGGNFIQGFVLALNAANFTICQTCTDTVVLSGSAYGTNDNLTLPVADLTALLALGNVSIESAGNTISAGDITISTPITWSSANSLTLSAYHNVNANASVTNAGSGNVILQADNADVGTGTVHFSAGDQVTLGGGSVKIYYNPVNFGTEETLYTGGTTPVEYMLINGLGNATDTTTASLATLSNRPSLWGEDFALNTDLDASATVNWNGDAGLLPIGNGATPFSGLFDGQGYIISNLTSNRPTQSNVGLFGATAASANIENLGVAGNVIGNDAVGIVVGNNAGHISQVFSSGSVLGLGTASGGLVGRNTGNLDNTESFATVTDNNQAGGLVGLNDTSGTINHSIAIGAVIGQNLTGGLIGTNNGSIQNSFWDTETTGQSISIGMNNNLANTNNVVGGCFLGACNNGGTIDLSFASTFTPSGFDFNQTWGILTRESYPYLLAIYPTTPRAISGQIATFSYGVQNSGWTLPPTQIELNPVWSSISANAVPNQQVNLIDNGTIIDSTFSQANGFYYFLERNGEIGDGSALLAYLSGDANKGNVITIAPTGGASISSLYLPLNTVLVADNRQWNALPTFYNSLANALTIQNGYTDTGTLVSSEDLIKALGNLSSSDLLYSTVDSNINVLSGYGFVTTPHTLYESLGNLTTTDASITFNGPTEVAPSAYTGNSATIQTNDAGNIENDDEILAATQSPFTLNLFSASNINLNGPIMLRDSSTNSFDLLHGVFTLTNQAFTSGSLNISAANTYHSIYISPFTGTLGRQGSVVVENFNLLQGEWYQTLPPFVDNFGPNRAPTPFSVFLVYNNFQINSGIMPSPNAEFIQATKGPGTLDHPLYIYSPYGLQGIGSDAYTLGLSYVYNINAFNYSAVTSLWNNGAGFVPIGTAAEPFTGNFNGSVTNDANGIANITINRPTVNNVGLFGATSATANISNVYLTQSAITGYNNVGAIVGLNHGTITGAGAFQDYVVGNDNVGELVGINTGTLTRGYDYSDRLLGHANVGGLAGENTGIINESYAANYVGGEAIIGGITGYNTGTIQNSFWDTDATGQRSAAGINVGILNDVTGGCLTGQCTNGGTADLSDINTYLSLSDGGLGLVSTSWNINRDPLAYNASTFWALEAGMSYPYSENVYDNGSSAPPRIFSGQLSPAAANQSLLEIWGYYVNGELENISRYDLVTGANGSFYSIINNPYSNNLYTSIANGEVVLLPIVGGSVTGSVAFFAPNASASNGGSLANIPLLTTPQAGPNTNSQALSDRQIINLFSGLPINAIAGDFSDYFQLAGFNNAQASRFGQVLEAATLLYNYNLAQSNYTDYYQQNLYEEVKNYLDAGYVADNILQMYADTQLWDSAFIKNYNIAPLKPAFCGK